MSYYAVVYHARSLPFSASCGWTLDGPLETAARKYSPPVLLMALAAPPARPREAGLDKQSTEQIYH
jgi:hypothetical protein